MCDKNADMIEGILPTPDPSPEEFGIEVHIHGQVKHLDVNDVLSVKKCEVQITAPEHALDPFVDIKCMKRERPAPNFNVWDGEIWLNTWFPDIDKSLYLEVTNTSDAAVKVHLNFRYYRSNYRDADYEFSNIEHLIKNTESLELILHDNVASGSIVLRKKDNAIQIEDREGNIDKLSVDLLPGETCDLEVGDVICNANNETLISFMPDYDSEWAEMSIDSFK